MKFVLGAYFGALGSVSLSCLAGAFHGAAHPPCIACGKTVGPFIGAMLGVGGFAYEFGLLAAGMGAVFGAVGSLLFRRKNKHSGVEFGRLSLEDQPDRSNTKDERIKRSDNNGIPNN
jgi:hypothetical protein